MKLLSKVLWPLAVVGLLAVSCMMEPAQEPETLSEDMPSVTATIAAGETRTSVDADLNVLWSKGDEISVFLKKRNNSRYALVGEGGEASGTFRYVSGDFFALKAPYNYGVYPYNKSASLSPDGEVDVTVPSVQPFVEGGFAPGVNAMVAASEDLELSFKNVSGYLSVKLYGEDVQVGGLKLKGNCGEVLAGEGKVKVDPKTDPELELGWYGDEEVTVECETPVMLGSTVETATEFWFVLAPVTFEEGFTLTVLDAEGQVLAEQPTSKVVEIERNTVYRMTPLCLKCSGTFAASVSWTYADDADVDHNLFYESEGTTKYSRTALPLGVATEIVEKYGEEIAAATPEEVTVTVADPETGETVPADDVKVSNITLKDGDLVADVEGFLWDKVYGVTVEYALGSCELTLVGSLTTVDRKREPVTLDLVAEYTFDINKLDSGTGFGYIEVEPVKDSWYKWESEPLTDAIYAAYLNGGVITKDDFANADEFFKEEVEDEVRAAPSLGTAKGFVTVSRETACPSTTTDFKASVLKGELFSSGKADPDDPYRIVGNDVDRRITTYIGQEVIIPIRLSYRVPKYDFLHLRYYTFNSEKEVEGFITKYDFEDNDGSVKWWSKAYPSYFTTVKSGDETEDESQVSRISNRYALADYDVAYSNLAELAFNVVDEKDEILDEEDIEEAKLVVKFVYADETLNGKSLPGVDQVENFLHYDNLWVDNSVFYYRTNEKKFIPVRGTLGVLSGGTVFELPTRFDVPKASFQYPEEVLDYSQFAIVRWTPFMEPVAEGYTIVLDENKIYREPLSKGMFLKDNRPNGVSFYVIKNGEWVVGDAAENATSASNTNGYLSGIAANDAYRITTDFVYDNTVPAKLNKLLSFEEENGVPYVVFDYTSEVQFHGVISIPVVVTLESPWQEKLTFKYDFKIKGIDD